MFQTYAKLSKYNQKISKNLLHLAAIFYVANMDFYLSINRIAKVWDQNIQNDYVNVSLLNRDISNALMAAKLSPPLENFSFVIDYTLKHLYSLRKQTSRLFLKPHFSINKACTPIMLGVK